MLRRLSHPNIIRVEEVISCESSVFIVTEIFSKLNLAAFLKQRKAKLPEKEAAFIFGQIAQAVRYLHQLRIAHRDIKLENLLIDRANHIKLIDFGFALESS